MAEKIEPLAAPGPRGRSYRDYHDREWGVPVHDDRLLFEFLILEGAQAGLSWETILNKRENYRAAFDRFDPALIARYGARNERSLLANAGIVRNRLKIASAIKNAQSVSRGAEGIWHVRPYIWSFVGGRPIQNAWRSFKEVPARTEESDSDEQGLEASRLQFRRQHDLVRLHASGGDGERSPGRLLPTWGTASMRIAPIKPPKCAGDRISPFAHFGPDNPLALAKSSFALASSPSV